MSGPDEHTQEAVNAFDDWAGHWSSHYASNGAMAVRITRFADALNELFGERRENILDYGCGTGEITRALAAQGWRTSGCDLSPEMLTKAKAADSEEKITWRQIDAACPLPLPFADQSFAAVYSSSVFEYLPQPRAVIDDIHRILKPGGWLLFTAPDPRHPVRRKEVVKAWFARFDPVWALIRRTRWQSDFRYLRISVSRPPLEGWMDMLSASGFIVSAPGPCANPLALIAVQKPGTA